MRLRHANRLHCHLLRGVLIGEDERALPDQQPGLLLRLLGRTGGEDEGIEVNERTYHIQIDHLTASQT